MENSEPAEDGLRRSDHATDNYAGFSQMRNNEAHYGKRSALAPSLVRATPGAAGE